MVVAEAPRRAVHRIGDQHVIAGAGQREQRQGRRGQARWHGERGVAAFERRDRGLQIGHRRQAVQAVVQALRLAALRRLVVGDRVEQDRRRAIDRRVDRAQMPRRVAPEMRDFGRRSWLASGFAIARSCGRIERRAQRSGYLSRLLLRRLPDVDDDRIPGLFERGELARQQRCRHVMAAARSKPRRDRRVVALEIHDADLIDASPPRRKRSRYASFSAEQAITAPQPRAARSSHRRDDARRAMASDRRRSMRRPAAILATFAGG